MTYAILQKSTGKFLPQFKGDYGASSVEPTYQDIMPPRLFRTEADAKSARRWWLAGHWTFNEDDDYPARISQKVASRNPDDVVVVQVSIVWSTQL